MAERIVSPGVFTRERDLSFLPQAIGEIGAAIIGPTESGPAFTPTQITSFQEFEELFGGINQDFYTPVPCPRTDNVVFLYIFFCVVLTCFF